MQTRLEKPALEEAVQTAARAVNPRSPLPVLSHILIAAEGNHVTFTATDLDFGITLRTAADVVQPGAVAVPARTFGEIVARLPAAPVTLTTEEARLNIHCGRSKFSIPTLAAEEFPKLPDAPPQEVQLAQGAFRRMVRQADTARAASDESRAVMTGILTQLEADTVRMVCTDGRRLAVAEQELPEEVRLASAMGGGSTVAEVIVPGKAMLEIARICADSDEPLTLRLGENQLHCRVRDVSLHCRLLEGHFPDYRRVMPAPEALYRTLRVGRDALLAALKRMLIVAQERQSPNLIVLDIDGDTLALSANTPDVGLGQEEVAAIYEGAPLRIAFNGKYMQDLLSVLEAEEVQVRLQDDTRSAVLQEWGNDSFRYLLMPVRLREATGEDVADA